MGDYEQYTLGHKPILAGEIKSIIFMPVKTGGGRAIGLVNVASNELDYFTPERTRYFTGLADGIGTLLENADLYQQTLSEL